MSDATATLKELMALVHRCPDEELAKLNAKQCLQLIANCSPHTLAIATAKLCGGHSDNSEFATEFWSHLRRNQVADLLRELPMVREFEGDEYDEENEDADK